MDGVRRLLGRVCIVGATVGVALAAVAGPAAANAAPGPVQLPWRPSAAALEDPPDVRGFSVPDARKALEDWNPRVFIQLVPQQPPQGVDDSVVVVVTATQLNEPTSPNVAVERPIMRLSLGARVPDLAGLTPAAAARELERLGLRLGRPSTTADPAWTATGQDPPRDTLVEFGSVVAVTFAPPETGLPTWLLIAAAIGLLLVALAAAIGVRASRRRDRRPDQPVVGDVQLKTHPGQVVGPHLTEQTGAVSVRVVPKPDRGTVTIEEARR